MSKMGKHKRNEPPIVKETLKSPKRSSDPSLVEQLKAAEKFVCEVLKLFEDI